MKKNITKLGAMALVGIMGMGLATTPVSAAAQKTTDVFYTTSSTGVDADGKVVMVVPASVSLTKANTAREFMVTMKTADPDENVYLPKGFEATVKVASQNKGKLKEAKGTSTFDYKLLKGAKDSGSEITLTGQTPVEFNLFKATDETTGEIEQQATVKVEDAVVKELEKKAPGTQFNDTLTFSVEGLKGEGLTPIN